MTIPNTMIFENLTRRHGVKVDSKASVEDICLAVGDVVNHENIASASRMNNAIVLFLSTIDPFTVYVTEVRSAHVGVRTFIPSHCVNQRISRQDKT